MAMDRAFSSASALSQGVVGLAPMFDDSVVLFAIPVPSFAHGPSEAVATLTRAVGSEAARLEWTPIRVGISADGQQGFTFGYVTTHADGAPDRLGKYIAYWVRRPDGWRVALFKLLPRPEGEVSFAALTPSLPATLSAPMSDAAIVAAHRDSLARREREFSDESQRIGLGPAFARFGHAEAVNVGGDAAFTLGAENIAASQPGGPGSPLVWSADQGVLVASSGDLGVTWGYLRRTGPTPPGRLAEIPFFTIWRRDSPSAPWLYIAE